MNSTPSDPHEEQMSSSEEREEIFRIHLARRKRNPENFDLKALAAGSQEFSGAEVEEAIISALYDAFYAQEDLTTGHVLGTLRQTVPLSKTMDEQINRLRSWAEGRARNASIARTTPQSEFRRMEL